MNRTTTLSVIPAQGDDSVDLTGNDFRASANGKPLVIKSVIPDKNARRIVLLLDLSITTLGRTSEDRNLLFDAGRELIEQMPPETLIGVGLSTSRLESLVTLTKDRQSLLDALTKAQAGQQATERKPEDGAIRDAIHDGIQWFGPHRFGDIIYVISDGYDFRSRISSSALSKELADSGIRLFGLEIVSKYVDPRMDLPQKYIGSYSSAYYLHSVGAGPVNLQDMIRDTGGFFVEVTLPSGRSTNDPTLRRMALSPNELHEKLKFQFRQILEVFRVEVQMHDSLMAPKALKLDWENLDKSVQKEFLMEYPKFLGPCSQQPSGETIN